MLSVHLYGSHHETQVWFQHKMAVLVSLASSLCAWLCSAVLPGATP